MLLLVSLLLLSQTAVEDFYRTPREERTPRAFGRSGTGYAFFEFAPASGAGMGAVCACGTVTGAKGEALTFTRGSSGTCTKTTTGGLATSGIANGDLVTCTTDQPRVEYDSAGTLGLLVESARTNSMTRSQEINNAAWNDAAAGGAGAPTLNGADAATAPDGTLTAEDYTFDATTGAQSSGRQQGSVTCGSVQCTASVYVKGQSGSGTLDVCMWGSTATCSSCAFVSTSWTRCTHTATIIGAPGLFVGNSSANNGGTARSSNRVYVWGGSAEAGAYATSYIPTTGAAANRLADVASLPLADGMALGSMAVSANGGAGLAASGAISTVFIDGTNLWEPYHTGGQAYGFTYVASTLDTVPNLGALTANTTNRVAQYRSTVPELCGIVNGAAPVCNGIGVGATITTSGGTGKVYPGQYTAAANQIDGIVSRVCVDPSPTRCR